MNVIYVNGRQFGYEVDTEAELIDVFFIKEDGARGWTKSTQTSYGSENQELIARTIAKEMLREAEGN